MATTSPWPVFPTASPGVVGLLQRLGLLGVGETHLTPQILGFHFKPAESTSLWVGLRISVGTRLGGASALCLLRAGS